MSNKISVETISKLSTRYFPILTEYPSYLSNISKKEIEELSKLSRAELIRLIENNKKYLDNFSRLKNRVIDLTFKSIAKTKGINIVKAKIDLSRKQSRELEKRRIANIKLAQLEKAKKKRQLFNSLNLTREQKQIIKHLM